MSVLSKHNSGPGTLPVDLDLMFLAGDGGAEKRGVCVMNGCRWGERSQIRWCVVETGDILEKCMCVEGNEVWKEKGFRFCDSRGGTEGIG